MRPIDADALPRCKKASFQSGHFVYGEEFVFVKDIYAAPTISCEECEHCNTPRACTICRCGSEFERKAP